jgi:predicted metalloprotease
VRTTRADGTTSVTEFKQDVNDAVGIAERYWAARFRASGGRFQPIRWVVPYTRAGEVSCGGQAVPRNNAVYCKTLTLDQGDLDEFREGLLAVGDDPDQPWFAEGSHGTAEQRSESFFRGYERSLDACGLG